MTMTYTQQTEMIINLDDELGEVYSENLKLKDSKHILSVDNTKLEVLNGILSRTIDNLESKLNKQIRLNKRVYQ